MAPIGSFSGLASGFQWRDMVDQMMQLEIERRFTPVQNQITAAEKRREAWNGFNSLLTRFSTSARTLREGGAFDALQTSLRNGPEGKTLVSATTAAGAMPGSYEIRVVELARAEKVSGAATSSTSAPLGIAGDFYLNGRRVEVQATDTLTTVSNAINAANAGGTPSNVSATILSTGTDEHRLVLTSGATGSRGIELVDGEGGVLQALGLTTGALAQNVNPGEASAVQTQRFASDSAPLASVLGVSPPPAVTTIEIDGQRITVDFETDTLVTLMNRIAAEGGTASIERERHGTAEMFRLSVAGTVNADETAADPTASQRVVELLGFQRAAYATPISAGRDALVEIDGFAVTRRTNTVSEVIAGVTLDRQAADAGASVELLVARDEGAVVKAAEAMVEAYNALVDFTKKEGGANGALRSNASLRSTMNSLTRTLLAGVPGLPDGNPFSHASFTGIELTRDGKLSLDRAKLEKAMQTNFSDVQALLTSAGAASDAEVEYVLAGNQAQPGVYAIEITQAATRATQLGSAWADPQSYAASNGIADLLMIEMGSRSIEYAVEEGDSLTGTVAKLNARLAGEGLGLSASIEGSALRLTAANHGSATSFTVSGAGAQPLGLTADTFVAGVDVEGTIGGLLATGRGVTLTGADGGETEGIAIRYTGTTARSAGEVRLSLGVGGLLERVVAPTIRTTDGTIATQITSIDRTIDSMTRRLDDIEVRLEVRRQALIGQFTRMEGAMSLLQSQGNWLAAQIQSLTPRQ